MGDVRKPDVGGLGGIICSSGGHCRSRPITPRRGPLPLPCPPSSFLFNTFIIGAGGGGGLPLETPRNAMGLPPSESSSTSQSSNIIRLKNRISSGLYTVPESAPTTRVFLNMYINVQLSTLGGPLSWPPSLSRIKPALRSHPRPPLLTLLPPRKHSERMKRWRGRRHLRTQRETSQQILHAPSHNDIRPLFFYSLALHRHLLRANMVIFVTSSARQLRYRTMQLPAEAFRTRLLCKI